MHGFKKRRRESAELVLIVGGDDAPDELADLLMRTGYHVVRIRALGGMPSAILAALAYGLRAVFIDERLITSEAKPILERSRSMAASAAFAILRVRAGDTQSSLEVGGR